MISGFIRERQLTALGCLNTMMSSFRKGSFKCMPMASGHLSVWENHYL
jgi:hypothetical protein